MTARRWVTLQPWRLAPWGAALVALALALTVLTPAHAQPPAPTPGPIPVAPVGTAEPPSRTAQEGERPDTRVTPAAGATEPPPGATPTPTNFVQQVFHIIRFPFETMWDAITKMTSEMLQQSYRGAAGVYTGAIDWLLFSDFGLAPRDLGGSVYTTPLFSNLVFNPWRAVLTIALLLLPATLTLTAVAALRNGAASVMAYADLKEALIGWVISAGAAAASFYLLGLLHRLSIAIAGGILFADFGTRVTAQQLGAALFNTGALVSVATMVPVVGIYLMFFFLFLASSVMLGLGMAIAAYVAMVYMLATVAPLMLVVGSLPPLRWLSFLWSKAMAIAFLVPIVDALLLKATVAVFYDGLRAQGSGDLGVAMSGLFITAGLLSMLVAFNYKLGEFLFGAIGEIHRQAAGATLGVVKMAAMAGGVLLGAAAGGVGLAAGAAGGASAGAGGGVAAAGGAGEVAAGAGAGAGADAGAAGGIGERAAATGGAASRAGGLSDPAFIRRVSNLAQGIGRSLSRSGVPGMDALGSAMEAGGSAARYGADAHLDAERETESAARHAETRGHWAEQALASHARDVANEARRAESDDHRNLRSDVREALRNAERPGLLRPDTIGGANPGRVHNALGMALQERVPHAPGPAVRTVNNMIHPAGSSDPGVHNAVWDHYANYGRNPDQFLRHLPDTLGKVQGWDRPVPVPPELTRAVSAMYCGYGDVSAMPFDEAHRPPSVASSRLPQEEILRRQAAAAATAAPPPTPESPLAPGADGAFDEISGLMGGAGGTPA